MTAFSRVFARLFPLQAEDMGRLERMTIAPEQLQPRRTLIQVGRTADDCFLLVGGWAAEYRLMSDGSRQILNFRLPGDVIGVECLGYEVALHSVSTLTTAEVCRIPRQELLETQREFPMLGSALLLMALREGAMLHEWEISLGRRAALQRLGHLLLETFKRLHIRGLSSGATVPFPPTQQDVADCLGLTTPYVNRLLRGLQDCGLVSVAKRRLTIHDPEGLAKAVKFHPDYLVRWREYPLREVAAPHQS